MLNDTRRNAAIEGSIASLDLDGKIVLEIGTGAGLIALLFARYGAKHVYTCEMNANMARIAHDIVAASGFGDRITVIHAASRHVIETGMLPTAPDIIFTETVDCGVIGEGFYDIREDIRNIAGPETVILPSRIEQSGVLIESEAIRGLNEVRDVCGFDLSAINRFSTRHYFPVRAPLHEFTLMTEATVIRNYDYRSHVDNLCRTMTAVRSGTVHGLLSWFALDFGGHVVSNSVHLDSHWHQAFHPLKKPMQVNEGNELRLMLDYEGVASINKL
ncbi:MAG: ribonucleotide-diphosphate reductase subunit beta [Parvibaculaceae bacterium]